MTDGRCHDIDPPAGDSVAPNESPGGLATGPVLLWLLVQLAALSVAALRIPLAAKYPQPAEVFATHVMLAMQAGAAALLFPYVLGDWQTATATIATAWPFAAAASILSGTPLGATALAEASVSLWLVALGLWSAALPSARLKLYGVAVAAALSIGGAALWYLASEFNSGAGEAVGQSGELLGASTLLAAIRQLPPDRPSLSAYLTPAAVATCGLSDLLIQRMRGRARLSTARARKEETRRPITS